MAITTSRAALAHSDHDLVDRHDHGGPAMRPSVGPSDGIPGARVYTCPMHPDVRQDHPGTCHRCGMTLEAMTPTAAIVPEAIVEQQIRSRRLWISIPLTIPVFILSMAHMVPSWSAIAWIDGPWMRWMQAGLATPSSPGRVIPFSVWAGKRFGLDI